MWVSAALSILGRLLGWVPAIAAYIAAYIAGKRSARTAALGGAVKAAAERRAAEDIVRRGSDGTATDQLRRDWKRGP